METALRKDAEEAVAPLPPLQSAATRLAATLHLGVHGRRRAGLGETFWQYRAAVPGDPFSLIDWRRSARSRKPLVREHEWEAAQTVWIWPDDSMSMDFHSRIGHEPKRRRAMLLGLALAILLVRGGERVGVPGSRGIPAASSSGQLDRLTQLFESTGSEDDYGAPPIAPGHGRVVWISDFLGDSTTIERRMRTSLASGAQGCLLQVVDPHEEAFPYSGRLAFESMGGELRYRADAAEELVHAYRDAMHQLRNRLRSLAASSGWSFSVHRTDHPAIEALVWLANAIGDPR